MDEQAFENIMNRAIAAETEAYDFYCHAAERLSEASAKKLFREFAVEKQERKQLLEEIKGKEIQNFSFSRGADYKIAESVELPPLSINMKPVEAIALAMKKEEEAMNTYAHLAASTSDEEKKNIFEQLARMEEGHKVQIEGLYTQMAFPEVW